jgi:hypothetical protein
VGVVAAGKNGLPSRIWCGQDQLTALITFIGDRCQGIVPDLVTGLTAQPTDQSVTESAAGRHDGDAAGG